MRRNGGSGTWWLLVVVAWLGCAAASASAAGASRPPNVVLLITDDQGYGDIGAHGNEMIRTPNLDRLHAESVRLSDFHVDPTCSPTRAALMSGRYSTRTGVWHTVMGRSLMRAEELTLAEVFAANGYRTAIFGKWHLGDNFPLRPWDQGFDESLVHGGGGVGQTPDSWGNDYFDDTYFHNGRPVTFRGYCTDIWFDNALRFIRAHRDRPFFACISTNAPHSPYRVSERYARPYVEAGAPQPMANFYGMIANIDENVGRLTRSLEEWGLAENTVLIFMTDNGTAAGVARGAEGDAWGGFNAGMRGAKGSEYDGGHRVPCYWRWPAGGIGGGPGDGRDVPELTAHIDVLPTLVELCGLARPDGSPLDGASLAPLLRADERAEWAPRTLFVHSQRVERPEKWRRSAVMTERWRLVNGRELYDIVEAPAQRRDVAAGHPAVVEELRGAYERWWRSLSVRFNEYVPIVIGSGRENPARLTCHDWHAPIGQIPWSQEVVRRSPQANGYWVVDVARAGRYAFTLRQRPAAAAHPIEAERARIRAGEAEAEAAVPEAAVSVMLELELAAGQQRVQTWLVDAAGRSRGAFFVEVERLE